MSKITNDGLTRSGTECFFLQFATAFLLNRFFREDFPQNQRSDTERKPEQF